MAASRNFWSVTLVVLLLAGLFSGLSQPLSILQKALADFSKANTTPLYVKGPFTTRTDEPAVYPGDLRDLPQLSSQRDEVLTPGVSESETEGEKENSPFWTDPVAQTSYSNGQMPDPLISFDGLNITEGGGWHPPDTNGDVGPNYYLQTVKIAMGIFDKATGAALVKMGYDKFFQGPPGSACINQNRGDVIALYDPQVDRWIVTDFALPGPDYYECIAISQTGDPVRGGWYYYQIQTNTGNFTDYWNDYPKLSVWADGWYMTANMFSQQDQDYGGVRIWALDREDAMVGAPMDITYFDCTDFAYCSSLLPANLRGNMPPNGSPEYLANVVMPNTINLWQFHSDWTTPANSTFTGPVPVRVADYAMVFDVPQKNSSEKLDSLGDRLMFQLQYRNIDGIERLYANHTVLSGDTAGIRWYEIHDPGGNPELVQQGTYQPDQSFRWMGSIAADKEGNIAIGYSISGDDMHPSIRYAGRLAGEIPNLLTQNEASLIEGTGSQVGSDRWGDYSSMSIDPMDDCTFWYTQEYIKVNGGNWDTRIGAFKFPSCGQDKGTLDGFVYDDSSNIPLAGASVVARGAQYNFSTFTDRNGFYSMSLLAGIYEVTAGMPSSVNPNFELTSPVIVNAFNTTVQDFSFGRSH